MYTFMCISFFFSVDSPARYITMCRLHMRFVSHSTCAKSIFFKWHLLQKLVDIMAFMSFVLQFGMATLFRFLRHVRLFHHRPKLFRIKTIVLAHKVQHIFAYAWHLAILKDDKTLAKFCVDLAILWIMLVMLWLRTSKRSSSWFLSIFIRDVCSDLWSSRSLQDTFFMILLH